MPTPEENLREKFQLLSTEHLLERLESGGLTEVAVKALEQVLAERNVSRELRDKIIATVKSENQTQTLLAPLGSRLFAQIADSIIAIASLLIGIKLSTSNFEIPSIIGIIIFIGYILLADGLPNGQSFGKRLLGIAVIDARTKKPCSYLQSLGRNLLLSVLGIIDWIFILGKKRQRLGDVLASTIVIKSNKI